MSLAVSINTSSRPLRGGKAVAETRCAVPLRARRGRVRRGVVLSLKTSNLAGHKRSGKLHNESGGGAAVELEMVQRTAGAAWFSTVHRLRGQGDGEGTEGRTSVRPSVRPKKRGGQQTQVSFISYEVRTNQRQT